MNDDKKKELLTIAELSARKAGESLLRPEKSLRNVSSDFGRDRKIGADVASENIIIDHLKNHSGFSILSEEAGRIEGSDGGMTWIVDPLDGSLNYSRSIPLCCVSIGLWRDNEPVLGVVYDFHRSEVYAGIAGIGAWLNGERIGPSAVDRKEKAIVCTGFPVNTDFSTERLTAFIHKVQGYKKVRLLGSAALSLSFVASGRADAYMENDIMIWDVAGGLAIARAAGCRLVINKGSIPNSLHVSVSNGDFIAD